MLWPKFFVKNFRSCLKDSILLTSSSSEQCDLRALFHIKINIILFTKFSFEVFILKILIIKECKDSFTYGSCNLINTEKKLDKDKIKTKILCKLQIL